MPDSEQINLQETVNRDYLNLTRNMDHSIILARPKFKGYLCESDM